MRTGFSEVKLGPRPWGWVRPNRGKPGNKNEYHMQGSQGGRERCDRKRVCAGFGETKSMLLKCFHRLGHWRSRFLRGRDFAFFLLKGKQWGLPLGLYKSELRDILIQVTQVSRKPGCGLNVGRHISEVGRACVCDCTNGGAGAPAILLRETSGRVSTGSNLLLGTSRV